MNCTEYREWASLFLDGELETHQQVDLFKHLAQCAECQSFIDVLLHAREAQRAERIPFPSDLDDRIISGLTPPWVIAPARTANFWKRTIALPVPFAAAIAIILIAALTMVFFNRSVERQTLPAFVHQILGQPNAVIVVYTMPPVEVHGTRLTEPVRNNGQVQN
jgi:hypothetical protein